jgi:chromosome partitioning protein
MATVAIVSRKGGSGKSTLASNMAAYLAKRNIPVLLGDLDRQQSMRVWLSRRPADMPAINSWAADVNTALLRVPGSAPNVILDTPGGLHGHALSKVVMMADAIVLPVGASVFDRESVGECWAELRNHPRIKSGRCKVACVGMRLDARTDAMQTTRDWALAQGLEWLGSLRSAQVYVRAVENGLSIFDLPAKVSNADRAQWIALLGWLKGQMERPLQAEKERLVPATLPGEAARTAMHYQTAAALRTPVKIQTPVVASQLRRPDTMAVPSTTVLPKETSATSNRVASVLIGLFGKLRYR